MTTFEIQCPSLIAFGQGALKNIGDVLKKVGAQKPLIVTSRLMLDTSVFAALKAELESAEIPFGIYSDVDPDPDLPAVEKGAAAFKAGGYDSLIGFGGGSAMDAAKAINLVVNSDGDISAWKVPNAPSFPVLPLVCIPTTAGTGSEVTRGIVITDPVTHEKMLFMGRSCLAAAAVIDPDMTKDLPGRLAADTGLDALTHALEAYVSKKRNPHSDAMALSALKLIGENIMTACTERTDAARSAMMLGAMQAGIAFSNASVALVHGLSRPFGGFFKVPHGMSNAILLTEVTKFSISADPGRYAEASKALGFAELTDNEEVANEKLVAGLERLTTELKVPTLAEFGVEKDDYFAKIETMASQAIASGSPNNNPRGATKDELKEIYSMVWK